MAPTVAVSDLLKAEPVLTLQDFDFYEIHEAFAAQVLATLKAWESEDYCRQPVGSGSAAWVDRSGEAKRQRLVHRLRPSFCRHRCTHPGGPGQAAAY